MALIFKWPGQKSILLMIAKDKPKTNQNGQYGGPDRPPPKPGDCFPEEGALV